MTTQLFNLNSSIGHSTDLDKQVLIDEIRDLVRQRNAIILAHNYQWPDVQDVADVTGRPPASVRAVGHPVGA